MNKKLMSGLMDNIADSSDEEGGFVNKQSKGTKKEQRKEKNFQRESHGVGNEKESSQRYNERTRRHQGSTRGREKDRESGTGRQAFRAPAKKGGYGQNNTGSVRDEIREARANREFKEGEERPEYVKPAPVPEEKIVDIDDYLKEKNMVVHMSSGNVGKRDDPKLFEDENTTALAYKVKTVKDNKLKKNDGYKMTTTVLTGGDSNANKGGFRRFPKKKKVKQIKLTDDDFPPLL